jgi:hypothetical protein
MRIEEISTLLRRGPGLFPRSPSPRKETEPCLLYEDLIRLLLPIFPDAEVTENNGEIVIYTGLEMPK